MAITRMRPSGILLLTLVAVILLGASFVSAQNTASVPVLKPTFSQAVAFDVSPPLRTLGRVGRGFPYYRNGLFEVRPEWGEAAKDRGYSGDSALQIWKGGLSTPATIVNFEGLSNHDN